jgi:hypothetical protein
MKTKAGERAHRQTEQSSASQKYYWLAFASACSKFPEMRSFENLISQHKPSSGTVISTMLSMGMCKTLVSTSSSSSMSQRSRLTESCVTSILPCNDRERGHARESEREKEGGGVERDKEYQSPRKRSCLQCSVQRQQV